MLLSDGNKISQGDDVDYINKKDVFGFTALDYTILYRKEEQFKFLRQRRASIDEIQVEKMINVSALLHSSIKRNFKGYFLIGTRKF